MYRIERNVPIPRGGKGKPKYPFTGMRAGDSFVIPPHEVGTHTSGSVRSCAARHGIEVTVRRQDDGSYRVWRLA